MKPWGLIAVKRGSETLHLQKCLSNHKLPHLCKVNNIIICIEDMQANYRRIFGTLRVSVSNSFQATYRPLVALLVKTYNNQVMIFKIVM